MRILALTRYGRIGASSRLRILQYQAGLADCGIDLVAEPFFDDRYIESLYSGMWNVGSIIHAFARRLRLLMRSTNPDAIWVEKEALPWLPWFVERRLFADSVPVIADYDDAVFHRYDMHASRLVRSILGRKIDSVMAHADLVLAGNAYLADRARAAGSRNVEILPTVVDINRYRAAPVRHREQTIVGWIGSPSTAPYLEAVGGVLSQVSAAGPVDVIAIGARQDQLKDGVTRAQRWSEETEVDQLTEFDIGIMPLPDQPWERGKCGYKLIQYMACGLPVIASPVGVNADIVLHGKTGFLADSQAEWKAALSQLVADRDLRHRMGAAGRERVKTEFSLQVQLPRLEAFLRQVA